MSKESPINISSSDDSDLEDTKSKNRVFLEISDDEDNASNDSSPSRQLSNSTVVTSIKAEPSTTSPDKDLLDIDSTPRKRLTLNKTRVKWLSCQIKVKDIIADKQVCKQQDDANESDDDSFLTSPFLEKDETDVNRTVVKKEMTTGEQTQILSTESETSNDSKPGPSNNEQSRTIDENEVQPLASGSKLIDSQLPKSSPLKYDTTQPRNVTPKKKTPLERYVSSPRKPGAFGSPSKELKQTTLHKESFSPKKTCTSSYNRLDDNTTYTPPLHGNDSSGYNTDCTVRKVQTFSYSQLSYLEGIEEEGHKHTSRYIDALLGLVTPYRKPSPDLCLQLLEEKLLNSHSNSIAIKTYNALKRIQAIHPVVLEQILRNVKFDFVIEIIERLDLSGNQIDNITLSLKASNALKALSLLVDLMQKEAKRKITPYKTVAFRLVSLERNSTGVTKILSWINSCVKLCCKLSNQHDYKRVLTLLQSLLQLSITVSENPDKCVEDLAGEMLNSYSQLPTIECRTLFLQTIQSYLLKSKFLLLYVDVFCEKAEPSVPEPRTTGMQHVIQSDFCRLPLKRDDVSNFEARMCPGCHRSEEECEEHAMVIAYSLQSYLFCHHKKLQNTPKRQMSNRENLDDSQKGLNRRHLSVLDQEEIANMGDKVQVFAGRLLSLCPTLTRRTTQLLDFLSDMRLWDPY